MLQINPSTLFFLLDLNFSGTSLPGAEGEGGGCKKAGTACARILYWRDGGGRQMVKHSHSGLNSKEPRLLKAWDGGAKFCLHDTAVPSPLLTVSIHYGVSTGHHPAPKARENA